MKDNQLIAEMLKELKRVHGTVVTQKAPLLTEDLQLVLRALPDKLIGVRDRAILLIGGDTVRNARTDAPCTRATDLAQPVRA